jgi:hypothetical protein
VTGKEHNTKDEMEKKQQPVSLKDGAGKGKQPLKDGNKEPHSGGEGQTGMQPGAGHPCGR